jgi:hypothetical protein
MKAISFFIFLKENEKRKFPLRYILDHTDEELTGDDLIVNEVESFEDYDGRQLPSNLIINGDLRMWGSKLKSLPTNLRVNGTLYISWSKIEELPDNLVVGGNCFINGTPLSEKYTEEEVRTGFKGVKGYNYFDRFSGG